jgi:hypothetical protein
MVFKIVHFISDDSEYVVLLNEGDNGYDDPDDAFGEDDYECRVYEHPGALNITLPTERELTGR